MMYRVKIQGGKTNTDEAAVSKAKIEYQTTTINDDDLNILDMCTNNQWLFFSSGISLRRTFLLCNPLEWQQFETPFCARRQHQIECRRHALVGVTHVASLVTRVTFTFQDLLKRKHGGL